MKLPLRRMMLTTIVCAVALVPALPARATRSARICPDSDSIVIHKKIISKAHKIGLYPDALHRSLFFTVRGVQGKVYQLYVFDLDGHLIRQTEIRNKQTTYISEMEKGIYLFDVFCDDDRIGKGKIAVM